VLEVPSPVVCGSARTRQQHAPFTFCQSECGVALSLVSNAADIEVENVSGSGAARYLSICKHAFVSRLVRHELLYLEFQLCI
jgi:hypothetical protein